MSTSLEQEIYPRPLRWHTASAEPLHLASQDYGELEEILESRPPLEASIPGNRPYLGSKIATRTADMWRGMVLTLSLNDDSLDTINRFTHGMATRSDVEKVLGTGSWGHFWSEGSNDDTDAYAWGEESLLKWFRFDPEDKDPGGELYLKIHATAKVPDDFDYAYDLGGTFRGDQDLSIIEVMYSPGDDKWYTIPMGGLHITASWSDVQTKAKRIKDDGGVRIISVTGDYITAHVQGDNGVYESTLQRGSNGEILQWVCSCPWFSYSFGRSGRWKKYEGRMCGHCLALQYQAQSEGIFKRKIKEDIFTPEWDHDITHYEAPPQKEWRVNATKNVYALTNDYDLDSQIELEAIRRTVGSQYDESLYFVAADVSDESRDNSGQWTSDDSTKIPHITKDEARGDSKSVTASEFAKLHADGKKKYDSLLADTRPAKAFDSSTHWEAIKSLAFDAAQESWGGQTIDPATGAAVDPKDGYSLSIKSAGQKQLSVPEDVSEDDFAAMMDRAKNIYADKLKGSQVYLGVFRDDDNHRIDIDPITIVQSKDEVDTLGAYTHAIGGAYEFATGNGHFPPHVAKLAADVSDEKRDDSGKWTKDGDSGTSEDKSTETEEESIKVRSPKKIEKKLRQGKRIDCPPGEVQILLQRIKLSKDPIDLHNLRITGSGNEHLFCECTMCLPRDQMPVIPSDSASVHEFAQMLADGGVKASEEDIDPRELIATQNQLDGVKVGGMVAGFKSGKRPETTIVVSRDGSILDGHHRWAAETVLALDTPGSKIHILRCDVDIDTLVTLGRDYDSKKEIVTKPFGVKGSLRWPLGMSGSPVGTREFGQPPEGEEPPDPDKPYLWFNGKWLLLATDDSDDVPRSLSFNNDESQDDDELEKEALSPQYLQTGKPIEEDVHDLMINYRETHGKLPSEEQEAKLRSKMAAGKTESLNKILNTFVFTDGDSWKEVVDNFIFSAQGMKDIQVDIANNGIRIPIPIDYSQTPPKVLDGHTRLAIAQRIGLQAVPVQDYDEFMYHMDHPYDKPYTADLHDTPEPALPTTDGADSDEDSRSWLLNEESPQTSQDAPAQVSGGNPSDSDIAKNAKAYLAVKTFSYAEQRELIDENPDAITSNILKLDLKGTHYEALEEALSMAESEGENIIFW